jgi:hypothetical protein
LCNNPKKVFCGIFYVSPRDREREDREEANVKDQIVGQIIMSGLPGRLKNFKFLSKPSFSYILKSDSPPFPGRTLGKIQISNQSFGEK